MESSVLRANKAFKKSKAVIHIHRRFYAQTLLYSVSSIFYLNRKNIRKLQIIKPNLIARALLLLAITIGSFFWVWQESIGERIVTLRMFIFFISGFIAFAMPFILFPDRYTSVNQLGNISGNRLMLHLYKRSSFLFNSCIVIFAVVCFGDVHTPTENLITKAAYFVIGTVLFSGLYLIALARYTRNGIQSQYWKESERGKEIRRQVADYLKYPMDPGSIPSLITTLMVTVLGMIAVSIGALLSSGFGAIGESIPAVAVLVLGWFSFQKTGRDIERYYYATNGFFREFFEETVSGKEEKSGIRVPQLWWVPKQLKPGVWALLVQLDRKFPAGRVLVIGHMIAWFIAYQRPGEEVMTTVWLLFALLHHAIIVFSFSDEFAPLWWQRWTGSASTWVCVRAWIQFRWILLLAGSIYVNSLIFGYPGYAQQGTVLAVYIISAFVVATAGHLFKSKKL